MSRESKTIDLGYAEKPEKPWLMKNLYFPSKIGGKPAWLDLQNLPKPEDIACPKCKNPRVFLCQIYAPIEPRDDCFHRTIFIFVCRNESCYELNSAGNMVVFRSQLSRNNDFYPPNPPDYDKPMDEVIGSQKLCNLCGCYGPLVCSKCKQINYCGETHQKLDWKNHKKFCKESENNENTTTSSSISSTSKILFKEYEIYIDEEPEQIKSSESEEKAEKRRLKEYEALLKSGKIKNDLMDVEEAELSELIPENVEDKIFEKFKERIELSPEQVLRYHKNGQPLWIINNHINEKLTIPNCENCKGERKFEFQIMPQLLNYLKDEHIDWGILAIYTCSKSCNSNSGYIKEFILKQDVSPTTNQNQ